MGHPSIDFTVRSADQNQESLTVLVGGELAGEASVRYESATACISARIDLQRAELSLDSLPQFHQEFASELLAYVMNRGAMAQGSEGDITYVFGAMAHSLVLPSHQAMGLGYPNSW